ncbi:MAG: serine protease, partial [Desulfobacterales bacterium]|nr:serine protease [Desulfobacterales bacterium]
VQPSVATVVAYDVDSNVANIGTGFFVNNNGHLITNYHVLVGKFGAEIKTADGSTYPIKSVIAENQATDLIKVLVDIPPEKVQWIEVSEEMPPVAQRVMVVGSPMGLEQSVSDGIISSVREIPGIGTFFQMSAPISPGSSGSPVVNMEGKVVGVATFQFLQGQNLNFAISGKSILDLQTNQPGQTLSEWTFRISNQKPRLAGELCRKGFSFSINGQDQKALQYFKKATENDPNSTTAWYGLGYCYAGKNSHNDAIEAYKQAIRTDPKNEISHFHLGNYYHKIGRNDEAIVSYKKVVTINPDFEAAHFNLGIIYSEIGQLIDGREAFQNVVRINPQATKAHYNIGLSYFRLGQYPEAIDAYKNAIEINPEFVEAYFNLGLIFGELGQTRDQMEAFKQAIRVNPDFAPAHYAIGQVYLNQGGKAAALDQYKILKKLNIDFANQLFEEIYG